MPYRFDCEDEPNEFMEAPCRCDCGNWFDLEDGHNGNKGNKIICRECKEKEDALYRGDDIIFIQDCIINGRTRAFKNERGTIIGIPAINTVSIKMVRNRYPIHYVPISYIKKIK